MPGEKFVEVMGTLISLITHIKPVLLTLSHLNQPKPAIRSILLCLMPDDFTCQWVKVSFS